MEYIENQSEATLHNATNLLFFVIFKFS